MTSEGQRALIRPQKIWYDLLWLPWNGFYSPIVKTKAKENKMFAAVGMRVLLIIGIKNNRHSKLRDCSNRTG